MGGYEAADPVDAHGEFGDVVASSTSSRREKSCRSESSSSATTVESVRRFDPGTQRSVETLDRFGIVPVREPVGSGTFTSNLFQFLRTRDAEIWVSEPTDVESHVKTAWEQITTSYSDAVERHRGGPEPLPPADLILSEDELKAELASAVVVEELAIEDSSLAGGTEVPPLQLSTQPTAVFHGRIPDWIADVKSAQANDDLVVFVAGSHGRAERTVELLKDYDVRAIMASDAGDVVRGAVMVAEGWLSKGFRLRRSAASGVREPVLRPQIRPQRQRWSSTPKPTSSTKNAGRPAPARNDRCRPPSSPTFATSRSAI